MVEKHKITVEGVEYEIDTLTNLVKEKIAQVKFVNQRIKELSDTHSLLQKAKFGYIEELKHEIIAARAGLVFNEDE